MLKPWRVQVSRSINASNMLDLPLLGIPPRRQQNLG
jgi:hypothetical protein